MAREEDAASARSARAVSTWLLGLAALYIVAVAVRLLFLRTGVYGDEAVHYVVARDVGANPTNAYPTFTGNPSLWWQRPMFSATLWAGAQFGFEGYRVGFILASSLLAPLVAILARQAKAGAVLATAAGAVVAVHPHLVLWGVRVFPDSLMACFALGGILAYAKGRHLLCAALLLLATWVKEVGAILLLAVFLHALWQGRQRKEIGLWPLRLDRPTTALLPALVLAPVPLMHAVMDLGGRPPGWSTSAMSWTFLNAAFVSLWLLVPIAAAAFDRASRMWAGLAMVYPGFYLVYTLGLHHGAESWYAVLPACFALVAAAAGIASLRRRARMPGNVVAAGSAIAIALVIVLPMGTAVRGLAMPLAPEAPSLREERVDMLAFHPFEDALAHLPAHMPSFFVADVGWYDIPWLAEKGDVFGWSYTGHGENRLPDPWSTAIEDLSNLTLLEIHDDGPMNRAIQTVYASCTSYQAPTFWVIDGPTCGDRKQWLRDEYAKELATGYGVDVPLPPA